MLAVCRPSKDTMGENMERSIKLWEEKVRDAAWTRCWRTVRELMQEEKQTNKQKDDGGRSLFSRAHARAPAFRSSITKLEINGSNGREQLTISVWFSWRRARRRHDMA